MGRDTRRSKAGRDAGGFTAIPWAVLDSPAYIALSVHAKALLLEVARQFTGHNNGSLLCSRTKLAPRGWTSNDMITKAKRELIAAGFLHETVIGQRPNKASWYALTWLMLDRIDGYDAGAAATFVRSSYRAKRETSCPVIPPKKTHPLHRPTVQEAP